MKRVNILLGRFQPFTQGHYICVETAKKLKKLPTVICMINTPESKVDKRHPFSSDLLLDVYSDLFTQDPNIMDVVLVKNANIVAISAELSSRGYQIASWTCGTDRYNSYSTMAEKYREKSDLSDDFEVIEVKRTDEDISATKARNCLLNDDIEGFISLMPSKMTISRDTFEILKKQVDSVYMGNEKYNKQNSYHDLVLEYRVRKLEKLLNRLF